MGAAFNRRVVIRFALTLVFGGAAFDSFGSDYTEYVVSNHNISLVVKVDSAKTILANEDDLCFYQYKGRVEQVVYGSREDREFRFSSDLALTVGGRYLVYLPKSSPMKFRKQFSSGNRATHDRCQRMLSTAYLDYHEVHLVKELWDGKKLTDFVRFSDVSAEFEDGDKLSRIESERFLDFEFVTNAIRKGAVQANSNDSMKSQK